MIFDIYTNFVNLIITGIDKNIHYFIEDQVQSFKYFLNGVEFWSQVKLSSK